MDISVVVNEVEISEFEETKELAWNCDWRFGQKLVDWWESFKEDLIEQFFELLNIQGLISNCIIDNGQRFHASSCNIWGNIQSIDSKMELNSEISHIKDNSIFPGNIGIGFSSVDSNLEFKKGINMS